MSQKIGIFAGSFDPIHDGHIAFAEKALVQAGLDKVVFLPEPAPRRKTNVSALTSRLEAIEQRLSRSSQLEVAHIYQPQFTVELTLPVLAQIYPEAEFVLLLGSDVVDHLHYWPHFEVIRSKIRLLVGLRQGADEVALATYLDALGINYEFVTTDYGHVASSQLR